MNSKIDLIIFLFKITPKSFISRIFGYVTQIPLPGFILNPVIGWYCKKFQVNVDEIDTPPDGFRTFDGFFTRQLKKGVHRFSSSPDDILSPVDGRLDQFGPIDGERIIQAKGIDYSLRDLIPSESADHFTDGSFMTLYLSPADYHRIHSPVIGTITGYFNLPGKLYTVQEFMVQGLRNLFAINERIISYIRTRRGMVAVCKVGAMNVGRISISHSPVVTNRIFRTRTEVLYSENESPQVGAGDEIGMFHLGSTVVLLFQKNIMAFEKLETGQKVRVGQKIGRFI
ncbi:MAG: phosphatidylserine decarboxylase [Spirochaetae bacterium HGW-Spirochaetae-1]|jgi:phosphatidylserine decarboxylase|nr:MAG: phosphatidylserine decarboxylase [Spirochaetae bacterium HGW-Spirochaetae-1]